MVTNLVFETSGHGYGLVWCVYERTVDTRGSGSWETSDVILRCGTKVALYRKVSESVENTLWRLLVRCMHKVADASVYDGIFFFWVYPNGFYDEVFTMAYSSTVCKCDSKAKPSEV